MATNIVAFDFNGVKVVFDSTVKLKHLKITNSAAVPKSLEDVETGSAYQIPTGKKLTIIYFGTNGGSAASMDFGTSTVVDSITGFVKLIDAAQMTSLNDSITILADLAADLFITRDSAQATSSNTECWGIEEDA